MARTGLLLLPACRRLRHTLAGFFQSHFILCWSLLPLCRLLWLTLGGRFLGIERGAELLHRLKPPPGTDPQAAEQRPLLLLAEGYPQLLRRDQLIIAHAVEGLGRCLPGEAIVDRGCQGIDIRPRSLPLVLVLLHWSKTVLQCNRHSFSSTSRLPGAAKVQKTHHAVFQHQIIRTDVTVDEAGSMHGIKRAKEGFNGGKQRFRLDASAILFDPGLEGRPLHIFHDNVGRTMFLKVVAHRDDLRLLFHPGQGARLVEKALLAPLEALVLFAPKLGHMQRHLRHPGYSVGGKIFLDSHPQLQPQIQANIGDAKAALSQGTPHKVSPQEHGARRKMVGQRRVGTLQQSANRARLSQLHGVHTVGTVPACHSAAPFSPSQKIGNYWSHHSMPATAPCPSDFRRNMEKSPVRFLPTGVPY